ncbi:hypothetical protein [Kitasatospora sp. NPDC127116]|uniref:hypothetical protein n=1 Tax=Kitasatospora sp. NPDC127116 TaxID=3345367 RepID=UPI00362782EE
MASKPRDQRKGLVDAYISGDCARCGQYVSTTIKGTHLHAHDPYDLGVHHLLRTAADRG